MTAPWPSDAFWNDFDLLGAMPRASEGLLLDLYSPQPDHHSLIGHNTTAELFGLGDFADESQERRSKRRASRSMSVSSRKTKARLADTV